MKLKLYNLVILGLLTLGMLMPCLIVGGFIWQKHLEFVATQSISIQYDHITINQLLMGASLFSPLLCCAVIFAYERYQNHRRAVLKAKIHFLEHLWQLSI